MAKINKSDGLNKTAMRKPSYGKDNDAMDSVFSCNLTKYRKRMGLTQVQLAAKLAVTPQAVSKWEKGSYPDCELLPVISKVLEVSLDVLFGLKDEDVKINLSREASSKLQKLPDSEKGGLVMEMFYNMLCAYNVNTSPENISYPDVFAHETFAHLRTDYELAIARLNPDMQFACFMRIPEKGIDTYFKVRPRIVDFFDLLSDEYALRIISYAENMERNYLLSKECISNNLSIPIEKVSEIIERFTTFGIMWELIAETGDGVHAVYGYVHNVALIGILTLAKALVDFIACREPDIDIWSKAPFRALKNDKKNDESDS